MSHKNNEIFNETIKKLQGMQAFGQSKHKDKIEHETQDKIYSYSTYKTYKEKCMDFIKYAKKEHKCKSLADAQQYVKIFLKDKIEKGYSVWTIKLYANALGKLYQVPSNSFIKLPRRERKNIVRSRKDAIRDKHFSTKNNSTLINFAKSCGLRRSELENLKGKDCYVKNGKWYIHVENGKGGKQREVQCFGFTKECVEKIKATLPNERVFGKINSAADIHNYRKDFSNRVYRAYSRQTKQIPKEDRYYCRGDLKGIIYDKRAMKICSDNLGHSRICVIAYSYLR